MSFDKICKQTTKKLNEDFDLVYKIAMYQYKFIREVMQHETDVHDVLLNKFMKFKLKSRFKQNKHTKYSPNNI